MSLAAVTTVPPNWSADDVPASRGQCTTTGKQSTDSLPDVVRIILIAWTTCRERYKFPSSNFGKSDLNLAYKMAPRVTFAMRNM